ncbi:MAG: Cro/CI family transcriptional regulator, partial [Gammaproteobacteria bacterium]
MKLNAAVAFFGSRSAVADACGVRAQTVQAWGHDVPVKHVAKLVIASDGALKVTRGEQQRWIDQIATLKFALDRSIVAHGAR